MAEIKLAKEGRRTYSLLFESGGGWKDPARHDLGVTPRRFVGVAIVEINDADVAKAWKYLKGDSPRRTKKGAEQVAACWKAHKVGCPDPKIHVAVQTQDITKALKTDPRLAAMPRHKLLSARNLVALGFSDFAKYLPRPLTHSHAPFGRRAPLP